MNPKNFKYEKEMDAGVRQYIEEKRNYLFSNYDLPPDERMRAEMLFADMEQMGSECNNREEFEDKFFHRTLSRDLYRIMLDNGHYVRTPEPQSATTPAAKKRKPAISTLLRKLFNRFYGIN